MAGSWRRCWPSWELTALRESLESKFASTPRDTWLHLDLVGRDPDAGMTTISYDKGHFFLRAIEEAAGRERWDRFLVDYFDKYAFQDHGLSHFYSLPQRQSPVG